MHEEQIDAMRINLRERIQALQALLPEDRRGQQVFEDEARKRAAGPGNHPLLKKALRAYEDAVNDLWLLTEREEMAAHFAAEFRRRNRALVHVDMADLSTEATFIMRAVCIQFALSDGHIPLGVFAHMRVVNGLKKFLGKEQGIPVSGKEAGEDGLRNAPYRSGRRARLEAVDEEQFAESPEDILLAREAAGEKVW